jgi:Na+/H+-dicarboxylate symporter
MVPPNIISAAAEGQMLGLIFFSIVFGYFMTRIGHEHSEALFRFWDAFFATMMKITEWVMSFAPIGVFGLVARTVAKTGFDAAGPLLVFSLTVVAALAVHALITIPLMIRTVTGLNPVKHFRAVAPALLTAFSTASSSATLPITMDCLERRAGVSNKTTSFVLPLGATVNMDGTALYECVAAMFIAQAYGLELSFTTQLVIVVTALVTSVGVAGIPSASLVAIAIILSAVGLPVEAVGVLFVFDRILDMLRTSVNVLGDTTCTLIVAKLQGEEGLLEAGWCLLPPAVRAGRARPGRTRRQHQVTSPPGIPVGKFDTRRIPCLRRLHNSLFHGRCRPRWYDTCYGPGAPLSPSGTGPKGRAQ